MNIVGLIVAVPEEAHEMRRRIRPHLIGGGDGRLHGTWAGADVRLQVSGAGQKQAEAAARRMLAGCRPSRVICAGLAGGLHPALRRGEVVLAAQVVDAQTAERYACESVEPQPATPRAVLMTMPRVVGQAEEKGRLSQRADMVDMESLAVARVCHEHGVPFLSVRVISDAAHESFPIDLNAYLDADGRVRRAPLALAALRRRGGLRFLLGMRETAQTAALALADYVEKWLLQPAGVGVEDSVRAGCAMKIDGRPFDDGRGDLEASA